MPGIYQRYLRANGVGGEGLVFLNFEEAAYLRGIEEDVTVLHFDRQGSEMRAFARTADAEAVAGLVSGAVRRAYEVSAAWIPEVPRFAIIEAHRQMPALVFVGAHPAIVQPQKDALLIERSFAVAESETFGGDIVDGGDTIHSENHINPR